MLVRLRPNVIAITDGYHGCHGVVAVLVRLYGLKVVPLDDLEAWDREGLGKGDVVHVETPLNPTGEALELAKYRKLASERGAYLTVDATFAPPPLQDPFLYGADVVMHSGTKYLGGHSDMLCGVLSTNNNEIWKELWVERIYLGSVMGSLEGWLGVRSVRTLEVRVRNQSQNAEKLVQWLHAAISDSGAQQQVAEHEKTLVRRVVARVQHASLQALDPQKAEWVTKQMPNGYGPVFAVWTHEREQARRLPSKLQLFHHATSLGGVESLIEWRKMSDSGVDDRLLRVSVGLEGWEDLKRDLLTGFKEVVADLDAKDQTLKLL
jgi:cystathionine gamma-synthase